MPRNKEYDRARSREYYARNRDRLNARHKKYNMDHKDELALYHKRYVIENKDKIRQLLSRPWHKYMRLRYASHLWKIPMRMTFDTYQEIISGDGCFFCGAPIPVRYEIGHNLTRIDIDGGYTKRNCVLGCDACRKNKRTVKLKDLMKDDLRSVKARVRPRRTIIRDAIKERFNG